MKTQLNFFLLALIGLTLTLTACKKDGDTPDPAGGFTFTAKYAVDGGASIDFSGQNVPGGQSATLAKYEAGKARSMGISGSNGVNQIGFALVDVGEDVELKSYVLSDITQGVTPEATASITLPGTGNFVALGGQVTLTRFNKKSDTSAEVDGTFSFTGKDFQSNKEVTVTVGEFKNVGVLIAQ